MPMVLPFKLLRKFRVTQWVRDSTNLSETEQSAMEETFSLDDADIVASQLEGRLVHMVVLDIDVPAALVPSSTPGHHHLFIDTQMTWGTYTKLLDALADAFILEPGYVAASKARGFTAVRLPWVSK